MSCRNYLLLKFLLYVFTSISIIIITIIVITIFIFSINVLLFLILFIRPGPIFEPILNLPKSPSAPHWPKISFLNQQTQLPCLWPAKA